MQEVITVSFKDTVNARQQLSTGVYKSVDKRGKHKMNCQKFFSKLALKAQKQAMKKHMRALSELRLYPLK